MLECSGAQDCAGARRADLKDKCMYFTSRENLHTVRRSLITSGRAGHGSGTADTIRSPKVGEMCSLFWWNSYSRIHFPRSGNSS